MLRTGTSTQVRGFKSVLLGATLAVCCIASADAAQPTTTTTITILLKIAGITGTSQIPGHVGDIVLSGFSTNDSNTGPVAGGGSGKSLCGQVTITKTIDQTSPEFLRLVLTGVSTPSATVTFQSSDGKTTPSDFYKVDLREIFVTGVAQTDIQADKVTETIVLQAVQFQFSFLPINGTPVVFGWNCATNQKM